MNNGCTLAILIFLGFVGLLLDTAVTIVKYGLPVAAVFYVFWLILNANAGKSAYDDLGKRENELTAQLATLENQLPTELEYRPYDEKTLIRYGEAYGRYAATFGSLAAVVQNAAALSVGRRRHLGKLLEYCQQHCFRLEQYFSQALELCRQGQGEYFYYKGLLVNWLRPLGVFLAYADKSINGHIQLSRTLVSEYSAASLMEDQRADLPKICPVLFAKCAYYQAIMSFDFYRRDKMVDAKSRYSMLDDFPELFTPKEWDDLCSEILRRNSEAAADDRITSTAAGIGADDGRGEPAHPLRNPRTVDDVVYVDGRYIENENSEEWEEYEYESWHRRKK